MRWFGNVLDAPSLLLLWHVVIDVLPESLHSLAQLFRSVDVLPTNMYVYVDSITF